MKISIIVPVYKVEQYLKKCIESLINQTYNKLEILLIDDGSPDNCGAICDEYAKNDSRIIVVHKENGGLSDARNVGLEIATGEYVMFVDSDDYIEETACEQFSQYFISFPDIIMGACATQNKGYAVNHYHDLKTNKVFSGKQYMLDALTFGKFPIVVWLNVYKRSFLNDFNLRFKKGILHEDFEFTPRAFLYANAVIYSKIRFYHYKINEYSISSRKDKTQNCADVFSTCLSLSALFENEKNKKLKKLMKNYLCNCYLSIFRAGNIYRKGKAHIHKSFVIKNSYTMKTRLKAVLFCISPKLFCLYGK